ncbi:MAG TPA: HK97 gp10 family phage protein [Trebonia sp.]|jgi:hypothetical protein|nr:HK97 gp10 family phage protein [Trebonia sp.]
MADGLTVEATNGPAFQACLEEIRRDVAEPKEALAAAGAELVAEATANAPRRTGRLAGSHRLLPLTGKSVRVTNAAPYAAVIHWGWPAHGIKRQPWLVATWLRSTRPMVKATEAVQATIDKASARTK